MKKNLKRLTATLLLGLGAFAGAQATDCRPPDPIVTPDFSTWTRTAINTYNGSTSAPVAGELAVSTRNNGGPATLLYYIDGDRAKTVRATSSSVSLRDVRYLQFGFAWSNYGTGGDDGYKETINFNFGPASNPVTYLTMTTKDPNESDVKNANIVATNGATLYDANGVAVTQISVPQMTPSVPGAYGVVDLPASYSDDLAARKTFYIQLPTTAPSSGVMQVEVLGDPQSRYDITKIPNFGPRYGNGDDFRVWLPGATPTTLCLRKKLDKGTTGNFTFITTNLDNVGTANYPLGNADSSSTPNQITIPVNSLGTSFSKTTSPSTVSDPSAVTFTEKTPGYTITDVNCTKPNLPDGSKSNTQVLFDPNSSKATVKALAFGAMTNCVVSNTQTNQFAYPKFTLTKNFTGYHKSSDKVNINIAETGGAYNDKDVSNDDPYKVSVTLTGTKLNFDNSGDTSTNTVSAGKPPIFTLGESFLSGTPGNYTKTYSCSNATTGGTTVTTTSTALTGTDNGPYQFTITPKQGDDITCTITNNLTVKPPPTIMTTKNGANFVTQGQNLTYTINVKVTNDSVAAVKVTDPLPAGTSFVSASDGGAADGSGNIVWNLGNLSADTSKDLTLVVKAPSATGSAGYETLTNNTINNTVTVSTTTTLDSGSTLTASKQTAVLFASINKQVRNVKDGTDTSAGFSDSASAKPGEKLEYCLNYHNYSNTTLNTLTITDELKNGQTLVAGGEGTNSVKITRGNSAAIYAPNTDTTKLTQVLNDVVAGETGSVCFQALVPNS